jgi:hypothetical protein
MTAPRETGELQIPPREVCLQDGGQVKVLRTGLDIVLRAITAGTVGHAT